MGMIKRGVRCGHTLLSPVRFALKLTLRCLKLFRHLGFLSYQENFAPLRSKCTVTTCQLALSGLKITPFSKIAKPSLEMIAHNSTVGVKDKDSALLWAEPTLGSKELGTRLLTILIDHAFSRYFSPFFSRVKMIAPSWILEFKRTASSRTETRFTENATPRAGIGSLTIGMHS